MIEVRVCLQTGLAVRLIPGDRCRADSAAPRMCSTALREMPTPDAATLLARSGAPEWPLAAKKGWARLPGAQRQLFDELRHRYGGDEAEEQP